MADKKKMTVAEMIAAARKADSKGGEDASPTPAESPPVADAPAESTIERSAPAVAKPAAPPKDAKKMSVAEMLAAARAEKSAPKPAAAAPKVEKPAAESAAPKAAAKPTAPKPAAAEKSAPAPSTEKDTASILAAIRKTAKPGPVSKAEVVAEKKPAGKPKVEVPPMPEKPAYARPRAGMGTAAATSRRGFMASTAGVLFGSSLAIGFTSLAVTNLLWVLGLARFMFPNILIEPPTKFKVGFTDDFAPGQVSEKYKAQFGVWIVRYEWEGQPMIYALKTVCTHLGCTPNWLEGEQKFKCPCHGSGFYKDGVNFEGPAPRPLERYAIGKADDGQLQVDKSATFHEETGQWADPACFVPIG